MFLAQLTYGSIVRNIVRVFGTAPQIIRVAVTSSKDPVVGSNRNYRTAFVVDGPQQRKWKRIDMVLRCLGRCILVHQSFQLLRKIRDRSPRVVLEDERAISIGCFPTGG